MAILSIIIILTNQIGAESGFKENFLPITQTLLSQDPPVFYRFGLNLSLGYSYYKYYPYNGEIPYLPDLKLSVSYRLYNGRTFNLLMRGVFSLTAVGRLGIYPKQTGTDRHLPYLAAGINVGLLDESIFLPRVSVKMLGSRVRNLALLPGDPYYRVEVDRSDLLNLGLELKKMIGSFDFIVTPIYQYTKITGSYRGYINPEIPQRFDQSEITDLPFDSPISKFGITFALGLKRFSITTGYLSNFNIGISYRLAG